MVWMRLGVLVGMFVMALAASTTPAHANDSSPRSRFGLGPRHTPSAPDAASSTPDTAAWAPTDEPERKQKTETSGLALSVGIGSQYPLIGIQASFYIQVPETLFRLVPYLGGGDAMCRPQDGPSDKEVTDDTCAAGGVVGVMGSWGHKHRVFLNASFGSVGAYGLRLHGQYLPTKTIEGIGLAVGYEYMAFSGFFFRCDAGIAYMFLPPLLRNESPFTTTLTLVGLGFKIW